MRCRRPTSRRPTRSGIAPQPLASEFGSGPLMNKMPLFLQSTFKTQMRFAEIFQSASCANSIDLKTAVGESHLSQLLHVEA
jgi:hypothetical protein